MNLSNIGSSVICINEFDRRIVCGNCFFMIKADVCVCVNSINNTKTSVLHDDLKISMFTADVVDVI